MEDKLQTLAFDARVLTLGHRRGPANTRICAKSTTYAVRAGSVDGGGITAKTVVDVPGSWRGHVPHAYPVIENDPTPRPAPTRFPDVGTYAVDGTVRHVVDHLLGLEFVSGGSCTFVLVCNSRALRQARFR